MHHRKDKPTLRELLKMYSFYISRYMDKGLVVEPSKVTVEKPEIYDNLNNFITTDHVWRVYQVSNLPATMHASVTSYLKQGLLPGILQDVITTAFSAPIDWTTPAMKRLEKAWNRQISEHKPRMNSDKLNTSQEYVKSRQSSVAIDSWNLLSEKTSKGSMTADVEMVVILRYPRKMSLKDRINAEDLWLKNMRSVGISITPINKPIKDLVATVAPSISPINQPLINFYTWLDENIAYSESYLPGKLDGSQIYLGRDIRTHMHVFSDLLNTGGGAMNMLVLALTGGGKSFYNKMLETLLLNAGVNVIIWDRDGEYTYLTESLNYPVIALGKNGGKYFNTIPISAHSIEDYASSKRDTMSVFSVLCNPKTGMTTDEKFIIEKAYDSMLSSVGVVAEDISTWKNADNLDYVDLYDYICHMQSITDDIRDVYSQLLRKLSSFFESSGTDSGIFSQATNINDFLHIKGDGQPLLLSINLQSASASNQSLVNQAMVKIKHITMCSLSDRIIDFNKLKGEYTAVVVEEFNQSTTDSEFVDRVQNLFTAGRKRNVIPILVTNSMDSILNGIDPKLQDTIKNINNVIVGAIKSDDIERAVKMFDLTNCEPILNKIRLASETENKSVWKNAFLVRVKSEKRTEFSVVKMHVPAVYRNSKMFKTRD